MFSEFEDRKNRRLFFRERWDSLHLNLRSNKRCKKSNVSQLVTHGHIYEETKEVVPDVIKKIIIVNRFKDIKPEERLLINVIEVARNAANNVLIIDSLIFFLKMFEQFKTGKLSSEDIPSFPRKSACELDR